MSFRTWIRFSAIFVAAVAFAVQADAAAFTPNGIVVVRAHDGLTSIPSGANTNGTATFLEEYSFDGILQQVISLPTTASGSNLPLLLGGLSTSEGFLQLSADGQYLTLAGYNTTLGGPTTGTPVTQKVVGRIDMAGTVDTSTTLGPASSAVGAVRSAVTSNGTDIWVGTSAQGIHYTTLGATGVSTRLSTGAPSNMRVVDIFDNKLYWSSASGSNFGVGTYASAANPGDFNLDGTVDVADEVMWEKTNSANTGMYNTWVENFAEQGGGSDLHTTSGQTPVLLTGFPTSGSHSSYDYWFKDSNTLYVADDGSVANAGGIQKWTYNGSTWSLAYTLLNNGIVNTAVRGLTGGINVNGDPVLFATTSEGGNNNLIMVADTGASSVANTIASAGTNKVFRGVALVPSNDPLPPPPPPPPPPGVGRLPEPGDVVFGLSDTNPLRTMELVSGSLVMDGGAAATEGNPWQTTPNIQSVEFDNFGNQRHNVRGNLLGVNFGSTDAGGTVYNFATNSMNPLPFPAGQPIGNTDSANEIGDSVDTITKARLASLSVNPSNNRIAVNGFETGTVIVYEYDEGDTFGAGAALHDGRETTPFIQNVSNSFLQAGRTQGTTWLDDNTVLAFSTIGDLLAVDVSDMSVDFVGFADTVANSNSSDYTAMAYNPDVSDYIYALYSGFTSVPTPTSKTTLFVFDPDDLATFASPIAEIDLSMNTDSGREIALDADGNLIIAGRGSTLVYLLDADVPGGLTDNSAVMWYESETFESFPGIDIGFGEPSELGNGGTVPEPASLMLVATGMIAWCFRRRGA
jgi:hypothetical protein